MSNIRKLKQENWIKIMVPLQPETFDNLKRLAEAEGRDLDFVVDDAIKDWLKKRRKNK